MTPDPLVLSIAAKARRTGLFAVLDTRPDAAGPASLGALRASGPDAATFLQAQVTNDVSGLRPGEGNLSARVTRTGHLVQVFSLHRLPTGGDDAPAFMLLMERQAVGTVTRAFEEFLISDDVTLEDVTEGYVWLALQGPRAAAAAAEAFGNPGDGGFDAIPANGVRGLDDQDAPVGTLAFRRSLTGDPGLILAVPTDQAPAAAVLERLESTTGAHGLTRPEGEPLAEALEVLRIEAGCIRVGPDTPERDRLLPETGLEQQLVSYVKGCYLGQEVIARVRTYGSLPFTLRGLVLRGCDRPLDDPAAAAALENLPDAGADLRVEPDRKVGQIVSRTLSPVRNAPVALAYLDRAHRTPGTELDLVGKRGTIRARVELLPFFRAPDHAARAVALYDRAVRVFAEGDEEQALTMLEEALRIDPGFADGYEALGVILGRSGRFHEAIDLFKRLEEVAPDEPIVNTNLSLYYMKLGDKQTAERESARALEKSLERGAGAERGAADAAAEQGTARREDALRKKAMFGQVLEIDPEDPLALFGLGNALAALEEWEEAAGVYARAARAEKDNSAVHLARGKALEKLDRVAEAAAVYGAGLEVASRKGDLMPLKEMENRLLLLKAVQGE